MIQINRMEFFFRYGAKCWVYRSRPYVLGHDQVWISVFLFQHSEWKLKQPGKELLRADSLPLETHLKSIDCLPLSVPLCQAHTYMHQKLWVSRRCCKKIRTSCIQTLVYSPCPPTASGQNIFMYDLASQEALFVIFSPGTHWFKWVLCNIVKRQTNAALYNYADMCMAFTLKSFNNTADCSFICARIWAAQQFTVGTLAVQSQAVDIKMLEKKDYFPEG